jgi:asparagine synthase (glutamine-hydrolysing)
LNRWALNKRKPWFYLVWEAIQGFLPQSLISVAKYKRPAPWLQALYVKRHWAALNGYESRLKLTGPLPSFQGNMFTLDTLRRQVACFAVKFDLLFEKRYPYLDRDLLEFIFATPREQIVRPGQRRSLMRRALIGVVPDEILHRKRKAYVARSPLATISTEWPSLVKLTRDMICSALGIVDSDRFREALRKARDGQQVASVTVMRTLALECWLRSLSKCQMLAVVGGIQQAASIVTSAEKN